MESYSLNREEPLFILVIVPNLIFAADAREPRFVFRNR